MRKAIAYIIISLASIAASLAQNHAADYASTYLFQYMTVENGLTNNFVDGIYKDSRGFMWISTLGGGLLRHDGYEYLRISTSSSFRIKSNYVRKVCEDNFGRLWIATERGIDVMDLSLYREAGICQGEWLPADVRGASSYVVAKDSRGSIWISHGGSLTRLDFDAEGNISKLHRLHPGIKVSSPITALCEIDGQMTAGINSRVMKITADERGNLAASPLSTSMKLGCSYVKCMIAKENELWIGTDNGLYRYNTINGTTKQYRHDEGNPMSISQNMISDLQIADNGQLIIGTLKGVNFYNSLEDNFYIITQYEDKENEHHSINCDFINCIFCDSRIIWLGTESGGVNKMIRPTLSARNYQPSKTQPRSISQGAVNSVYVDSGNTVWAGCVEGGLNCMEDPASGFSTYTTRQGLSHNSVSCIQPLDAGTLVLGTWGGGITFFDKARRKGIKTVNIDTDSINTSFVGALVHDTINSGLWIGTSQGLYFYSLKSETISTPLPDSINSMIKGCLGAIATRQGCLMMGTTVGILKISLKDIKPGGLLNGGLLRYEMLLPEDGDTEYRSKVTCICQHDDSTTYLGTNGYGLLIFKNGKIASQINTRSGLPSDIVTQIIEDNSRRLWLATANGLCCYSIESGRAASFFKEEGLCDSHFYWNAGFRKPGSSLMYFGAMRGLVEIDMERSFSSPPLTKVRLTTLQIDGKPAMPGLGGYISSDISCASEIRIHERDKGIVIEFSALNYSAPSLVEYQYRLKGYRDEWTPISKAQRMAAFSNLPRGTYTFQARCATASGEYGEPAQIEIKVEGYFWKRWWFIALTIAAIAAAFQLAGISRLKRLREQKNILEDMVNRRTAALESKTEELSRQNEMLFSQNEEISRQKTKMEQLNNKIQELTIDKLAFFTNITHEFRTPLTLIIGPIERALRLSTNPKVIEQLNFVSHNSKHLLSLVNQLMDFRKIETDNMPVSLQPDNFQTFLEDVLLPFRALTQDNGVKINLYTRLSSPFLMFDREAMMKIMTNLVGNAEKFTPQDGQIDIYAASLAKSRTLYICVSDSGSGIVEEDINKVFNSFYQSKTGSSSAPGTGIGLYLCKKLARLLGGDITARNGKRRGAQFRLTVPLIVQDDRPAAVSNFISDVSDSADDMDEQYSESSPRMAVLVVEDNAEMRQYIRTVLSDTFTVLEASDGNNALQVLGAHVVDLVLSDMMMPGMDGLELTQAIRANADLSHIPVIILTAKTSRDSQLEGLRAGADDYIIKPFDEAMLKAKITSLMDNRRKFQKRFQKDMNPSSLNIPENSYDKKFIDKVLRIIKENYKNPEFEVNDLVTLMGVSKTLMNKKMQGLTQQSAGPFIRSYRLKVAHDLIIRNRITHNMNISEIAYEVGFNDPKYFTRCFTKQYGQTPSALMDSEQAG